MKTAIASIAGILGWKTASAAVELVPIYRIENDGSHTRVRMKALKVGDRFVHCGSVKLSGEVTDPPFLNNDGIWEMDGEVKIPNPENYRFVTQ